MKNVYLLLLLLPLTALSQTIDCGVENVSNVNDELLRKETIRQLKAMPNVLHDLRNGVIAYIPVKAHLIGEDDGTDYLDPKTVNKLLARLNNAFHEIDIQFYFSGTDFNRYPNSTLNAGDPFTIQNYNFSNANNHNNAINIYFAKRLYSNAASVGGLSPITPTQLNQNRIWYHNTSAIHPKTFIHEFGHFFGLLHTFSGSTSSVITDRELVTRNFNEVLPRISANCDLKGDYVCDTPADPFGNSNTDVNFCMYSGTLTDANGDIFSPGLTNYMGYYTTCVPFVFSEGQYERMRDGLLLLSNPSNAFTLDAPETLQDVPTNLTGTAGSYGVTLSWTDNSNVETGYMIERAPAVGGPYRVVAGTARNETMLENVPAVLGEQNFYRIKPSNSKNNYSVVSNSVVSGSYCANYLTQTCGGFYPESPSLIVDDFKLFRNGETLIENLDTGCSVDRMGDYYNVFSAQVAAGQTIDFEISSRQGTNGGAYQVEVNLYADWNQDYDFDDVGELIFESQPSSLGVSGSFDIPSDIAAGNYRMRTILTNAGNQIVPCNIFAGEMEDYKLSVNVLNNLQWNSHTLAIAPNPVTNILEIQSDIRPDRLIVTDVTGKIVLDQNTDAKRADVAKLATGMYIINVFSEGQKFQAKFVKQ